MLKTCLSFIFMFSLELKYQIVAKYSDPEQIIIFLLFTPPEFPCLNSKDEDPNLGLVCLFVLLCNLNGSPFS